MRAPTYLPISITSVSSTGVPDQIKDLELRSAELCRSRPSITITQETSEETEKVGQDQKISS